MAIPSDSFPNGMVRMSPSGLSARYGAPAQGVSSRNAISSANAGRADAGSPSICASASGTASYEYTSQAEPLVDPGLENMTRHCGNVFSALEPGDLVQHSQVRDCTLALGDLSYLAERA